MELPIYTVVPRLLYAGAHPLWTLQRLVEHGVRSFIDLTEPDEISGRSPAPEAYTPELRQLSRKHWAELTRHSFPIEDFGVPDAGVLDGVLDCIDRELAQERPVYVHCWGGYGRTGIVMGAWLIRHKRATAENFVDIIASLREHLPNHFSSPVTEQQKAYVREYVGG